MPGGEALQILQPDTFFTSNIYIYITDYLIVCCFYSFSFLELLLLYRLALQLLAVIIRPVKVTTLGP
jgi:hypothetical protein